MKVHHYLLIFSLLDLFCVHQVNCQVPTITTFIPAKGSVGTAVTITGTNFSATPADNIVYFGATSTPVTSATSTQLSVVVPNGATYQPITVTVNGLTAYSSAPFVVTFEGNHVIDESTFAKKVDFAMSAGPFELVTGDFSGDGKTDMIVSNPDGGSISVLRNKGLAGVISPESFDSSTDSGYGRGLAVGDLDGDGKMDLVSVTNGTTIRVFKNTSPSGAASGNIFTFSFEYLVGYSIALTDIAIGDIDADGKPDLAVTDQWTQNRVLVFKNTSSAGIIDAQSFAPNVDFNTGPGPGNIKIADIDGDGKPELIVANNGGVHAEGNTISILKNTSIAGTIDANSFASKIDFNSGRYPSGLALGDLDGDNKVDIAVTNYGSASVSVLKNKITNGIINPDSFAPKVDLTTGTGPNGIAMGDLDGDGKLDLAVANANFIVGGDVTRTLSVLRNTTSIGEISASSFAPKVDYSVGTNPISIVIADFDGDSKPDLAVANNNSNTISVLWHKNEQTITGFVSISVKNMGDPSFTLSASATSALTVQFTTQSDKVTIAGNEVTIVKPGSVTINAEQSGDNIFAKAPVVPQTFCINPSKPTITVDLTDVAKPKLSSSNATNNQWYLNETLIVSASENEYVVKAQGVYTLKVVVDGCTSPVSESNVFVVTGDIKPEIFPSVKLYPNPVQDLLTVQLHGFKENEEVSVMLMDGTGKTINRQIGQGGQDLNVDVRSYNTGPYYIMMIQGNTKYSARFIKQ